MMKEKTLGALLLAGSVSAMAQAAPAVQEKTLGTVVVTGQRVQAQGKDSVRATQATIGKGKQKLRDIPQSVTVVTEKLLDDRRIDTLKEALKNTSGVTFLAAEGGEEDIRLRGFSLAQTGDIYLDGMRDPAFYDRDNFNLDRIEVLRGSASMLFGRGSTGGAVNQASKEPHLMDENQIDVTVGSFDYKRLEADVNKVLGESSALRLTAMHTKADNNGAGSSIDKSGLALAVRTGIGMEHELQAQVTYLNNRNGMNYGLPWLATGPNPEDRVTLPGLKPTAYFGMASDYNHGTAGTLGLSHLWRIDGATELKTQIRKGQYTRDQRASTIRFCGDLRGAGGVPVTNPACPTQGVTAGGAAVDASNFGPNTIFTRGTPLKIQDMDTLYVQSDLSKKFEALGMKHELLAGIELSSEDKTVYAARTAAQGGVDLTKPPGTIGNPGNPSVNESSRVLYTSSDYSARSWGVYAQDMMHLTPEWKAIAGLRYDKMRGSFRQYALPATMTQYDMNLGEWSPRVGLLYQPNEQQSWYASVGQSFNPTAESYSLSAANVDTPPEKSRNLEIGLKGDTESKRVSYRVSLFRSTKYNERNTDPLLFVPSTTTPVTALTGQRHTAGVEFDLAGRITPQWEVYTSWMWMPTAKVDKAAPCPAVGSCAQAAVGERPGDRPALTPKLSGTVWSTYQLTPVWRLGAGLNYRSSQAPTRAAFQVPAFTTADVMAEYTVSDKLVVKANISNIGNKYYADQLYPGHYIPGAGRNAQVTASFKF